MKVFGLMFKTLLGVVCLSFAMLSEAQDDASETEPTVPSEEEVVEPAVPPATRQERFIPSEKINADTEISFPIDI